MLQSKAALVLTTAHARAGVSEGLRVAAERLHSGFTGAAIALKAPLQRADSFSAAARRALRAAPQVCLDKINVLADHRLHTGDIIFTPQAYRQTWFTTVHMQPIVPAAPSTRAARLFRFAAAAVCQGLFETLLCRVLPSTCPRKPSPGLDFLRYRHPCSMRTCHAHRYSTMQAWMECDSPLPC